MALGIGLGCEGPADFPRSWEQAQRALAIRCRSQIPHGTADAFVWRTPTRAYRLADYRRTSATYPYYALVPQGRFLPFLVERAARFPGFRVEMGARVSALLRDPDRDVRQRRPA